VSRRAVAIDLGGTQVRAALVDAQGNILKRTAAATKAQEGPAVIVEQIVDAADEVMADTESKSIIGIGVSSPGPLDTDAGVAILLPNFKDFVNFPLRAALQDKFAHRVILENDGIAAAIGEWKYGAGKGLRSLVYITVSTGIGGGVIVDGHVLHGRMGMGGHIGHMTIDPHGPKCNCGNTGCWERYAAGPFFAARAREKAESTPQSTLHRLGASLQPQNVFEAAHNGDELAIALVNEEAFLLGAGITSLLYLYSPEMIVIGGGLSNALGQLLPGIQAYIADNAMSSFKDVPIVRAALGGNSGLVGAVAPLFADS
jgi:glucokinase